MNRMIDLILTIVSKNAKKERIVTKANIHNFLALAFFSLSLSSDCMCICFKCVLLTHAFTFVRSIERNKPPLLLFPLLVQATSNLRRKDDTCMNEYICMHIRPHTFRHFSL